MTGKKQSKALLSIYRIFFERSRIFPYFSFFLNKLQRTVTETFKEKHLINENQTIEDKLRNDEFNSNSIFKNVRKFSFFDIKNSLEENFTLKKEIEERCKKSISKKKNTGNFCVSSTDSDRKRHFTNIMHENQFLHDVLFNIKDDFKAGLRNTGCLFLYYEYKRYASQRSIHLHKKKKEISNFKSDLINVVSSPSLIKVDFGAKINKNMRVQCKNASENIRNAVTFIGSASVLHSKKFAKKMLMWNSRISFCKKSSDKKLQKKKRMLAMASSSEAQIFAKLEKLVRNIDPQNLIFLLQNIIHFKIENKIFYRFLMEFLYINIYRYSFENFIEIFYNVFLLKEDILDFKFLFKFSMALRSYLSNQNLNINYLCLSLRLYSEIFSSLKEKDITSQELCKSCIQNINNFSSEKLLEIITCGIKLNFFANEEFYSLVLSKLKENKTFTNFEISMLFEILAKACCHNNLKIKELFEYVAVVLVSFRIEVFSQEELSFILNSFIENENYFPHLSFISFQLKARLRNILKEELKNKKKRKVENLEFASGFLQEGKTNICAVERITTKKSNVGVSSVAEEVENAEERSLIENKVGDSEFFCLSNS